MNRTFLLLLSLGCATLWPVSVFSATKYWDIDGATPGAGGPTPSGTWNTSTANWSTDSSGASAGTTWADGDDAIFSAGTDATGVFTNIVSTSQTAGNLTVEEGDITFGDSTATLNIGNFVAGKGIINVATGSMATIEALLTGGDDTSQFTKTGTGTLVLTHDNFGGVGQVVIKEGVVVAADNTALGDISTPTIVSNGAALHLSGGRAMGEPIILNGNGVANNGAIRGSTVNSTWTGGATLGSDARIDCGGARFDWNQQYINGTNGGNNFNLTVGGDSDVGRVRLNLGPPYNYAFILGTGEFTKEGTCLLQLETPSICSAFYYNGGDIYPRNEGATRGFGQGPVIFVGPGAGAFRASFLDVPLAYGLSLAAGANLGFNCAEYPAASGTLMVFTVEGVISGSGGLRKFNKGVLLLPNTNTYNGNTTIEDGFLTLGANGSISNTPVIDVWSNGVFNVTANTGGFVLQPTQTLKGSGAVWGNVTANGTLSPGASVGSLTNEGNLILGGNVLVDVDKSLSPSNDLITVTGSLSHSGGATLTVANLGPALAVNDNFQIFNKAVSGGQTIAVTGTGATWTNKLAVDGSIAVLVVPPPAVPATNLTIQAIGPATFSLGGRGAANSAYDIYASTNVALPMSNWWKIGSTNSDIGGVIQFVDPLATNVQRFYRFGQTMTP